MKGRLCFTEAMVLYMKVNEYPKATVRADDGKRLLSFYYSFPDSLSEMWKEKCETVLTCAGDIISKRFGKRVADAYSENPDPGKKLHTLPLNVRMEAKWAAEENTECLRFVFLFYKGGKQLCTFSYKLLYDPKTELFQKNV